MKIVLTAEAFEVRLRAHQSDVELAKIQRYFTSRPLRLRPADRP
jgi:hypothetical protein